MSTFLRKPIQLWRQGDCAQCEELKKTRIAYHKVDAEYDYFKSVKEALEMKLEDDTELWKEHGHDDVEDPNAVQTRDLIQKTVQHMESCVPDHDKAGNAFFEQAGKACVPGCSSLASLEPDNLVSV